MKIGIVLHPYAESEPGGLARSIYEWTAGLLRNDHENKYTIFLKNEPTASLNLPGSFDIRVLGGGRFWLDKLKVHPESDVYILQTPVLPLSFKLKKSIVIIQDFPYKYLDSKTNREVLRNILISYYHKHSLKKADALIAVSESTKKDVINLFGIPASKITTIHMGFKNICEVPEEKIKLPEKFFFYAGVIKERKNIISIIKALQEFKQKSPEFPHRLVLAGKFGANYSGEIKKYIKEKGVESYVEFIGYLKDGELSYAYKRAEALVFPSIIEGFGFPVLEAMACGTPVITSNIFGPSEIGKNAALLVNPINSTDIAEAMTKIVTDKTLRENLVKAGIARSKTFSWDKTAKKTLEFISFVHNA